jgi:hypothetical protein
MYRPVWKIFGRLFVTGFVTLFVIVFASVFFPGFQLDAEPVAELFQIRQSLLTDPVCLLGNALQFSLFASDPPL